MGEHVFGSVGDTRGPDGRGVNTQSSAPNADHERERKEEEAKEKRRRGFEPWKLGDGSAELAANKPWWLGDAAAASVSVPPDATAALPAAPGGRGVGAAASAAALMATSADVKAQVRAMRDDKYVVLCCAVLCCAVLCCAVLCCAVLCCAVLCCAVLCCAVLCSCSR
jgi:hypothetical protein